MSKAPKYLQAFCGRGDEMTRLTEPFSVDEFTYATDRSIALRVARCEDAPDMGFSNGELVKFLADKFPAPGDCPDEWPPIPSRDWLQCPEMKAVGAQKCRLSCPECGGTGRVPRIQRVPIAGEWFNSEYLRLMKMFLKEVRVNRPAKGEILRFVFEGGCGILMHLAPE